MDDYRGSLPQPRERNYHLCAQEVGERILEEGIAIIDGVLSPEGLLALRAEALRDFEEGNFQAARIGKGILKRRIGEIRGDRIRWLDRAAASPAQGAYWEMIDGLRTGLAEFFRVHLERTEVHFAVYPEGASYARHVDQFRAYGNRIVSVILYLNPEWTAGDGGELRIYPETGPPVDYSPLHGRLVLFRSDQMEHEVLASHCLRVSLTGWMRRDVAPIL
jgi:SM-20-related protein